MVLILGSTMKEGSSQWTNERPPAASECSSAPRPENASQGRVFLWDHQQLRIRRVAGIVSDCGAHPVLLESLASLHRVECSLHSGLVLLALEKPPLPGDLVLEVIIALKHKGFHVIAYEDSVQDWTVGTRCHALLAGAASLLDSAAPEFGTCLADLVRRFLRNERQRAEEEQQIKDTMTKLGMIGESPPMMTLSRLILRVSALSDVPVLIGGETGTGKELVARAIHSLDLKRCRGPFVALNCAAVSAGLAESELFGHRRGAFTGADQHRKGLIRSAQGGVLFLDEIGEMELSLQAKLLRVLQDGCILGVGEEQEVPVDVRVLAASNRDLEQMVRERAFRADLFHRVNVLSLRIPPLRERRDDIPRLMQHFLVKYEALGRCATIDREVVDALIQLDLPGNVRELENLIRSALVNRKEASVLRLGDLPPRVWQELTKSASGAPEPVLVAQEDTDRRQQTRTDFASSMVHLMQHVEANGWSLSQCLEYCERALLESALHSARGNQAQVARLLRITPRCVYNKLHKHNLQCKKIA